MELLNNAVIGGVVGTLITGWVMIWLNHKKEERLENAVLQAIKTEIEIIQPLFHGYKSPIDILVGLELEGRFSEERTSNEKYLDDDTQKLLKCFDITLINMPDPIIYYNNCSSIGKIKDESVRRSIVIFYYQLDFFRKLILGFARNQKTADEMLSDYFKKENILADNLRNLQELYLYNLKEISNVLFTGIKQIKEAYDELDESFNKMEDQFKKLFPPKNQAI